MTSRMVAIAAACLVSLCILLFLMGIEIGKQWGMHATTPAFSTPAVAPAAPANTPAATPKAQPSTS